MFSTECRAGLFFTAADNEIFSGMIRAVANLSELYSFILKVQILEPTLPVKKRRPIYLDSVVLGKSAEWFHMECAILYESAVGSGIPTNVLKALGRSASFLVEPL